MLKTAELLHIVVEAVICIFLQDSLIRLKNKSLQHEKKSLLFDTKTLTPNRGQGDLNNSHITFLSFSVIHSEDLMFLF